MDTRGKTFTFSYSGNIDAAKAVKHLAVKQAHLLTEQMDFNNLPVGKRKLLRHDGVEINTTCVNNHYTVDIYAPLETSVSDVMELVTITSADVLVRVIISANHSAGVYAVDPSSPLGDSFTNAEMDAFGSYLARSVILDKKYSLPDMTEMAYGGSSKYDFRYYEDIPGYTINKGFNQLTIDGVTGRYAIVPDVDTYMRLNGVWLNKTTIYFRDSDGIIKTWYMKGCGITKVLDTLGNSVHVIIAAFTLTEFIPGVSRPEKIRTLFAYRNISQWTPNVNLPLETRCIYSEPDNTSAWRIIDIHEHVKDNIAGVILYRFFEKQASRTIIFSDDCTRAVSMAAHSDGANSGVASLQLYSINISAQTVTMEYTPYFDAWCAATRMQDPSYPVPDTSILPVPQDQEAVNVFSTGTGGEHPDTSDGYAQAEFHGVSYNKMNILIAADFKGNELVMMKAYYDMTYYLDGISKGYEAQSTGGGNGYHARVVAEISETGSGFFNVVLEQEGQADDILVEKDLYISSFDDYDLCREHPEKNRKTTSVYKSMLIPAVHDDYALYRQFAVDVLDLRFGQYFLYYDLVSITCSYTLGDPTDGYGNPISHIITHDRKLQLGKSVIAERIVTNPSDSISNFHWPLNMAYGFSNGYDLSSFYYQVPAGFYNTSSLYGAFVLGLSFYNCTQNTVESFSNYGTIQLWKLSGFYFNKDAYVMYLYMLIDSELAIASPSFSGEFKYSLALPRRYWYGTSELVSKLKNLTELENSTYDLTLLSGTAKVVRHVK